MCDQTDTKMNAREVKWWKYWEQEKKVNGDILLCYEFPLFILTHSVHPFSLPIETDTEQLSSFSQSSARAGAYVDARARTVLSPQVNWWPLLKGSSQGGGGEYEAVWGKCEKIRNDKRKEIAMKRIIIVTITFSSHLTTASHDWNWRHKTGNKRTWLSYFAEWLAQFVRSVAMVWLNLVE